jgi:hypothetical protein
MSEYISSCIKLQTSATLHILVSTRGVVPRIPLMSDMVIDADSVLNVDLRKECGEACTLSGQHGLKEIEVTKGKRREKSSGRARAKGRKEGKESAGEEWEGSVE